MAWTDSEELAFVETALEAIYSGAQSYSVGGRTVTRAQLSFLTQRKDQLTARINRATRGGVQIVKMDRPT